MVAAVGCSGMKVEDLLPIVKRELARVGMVEHVDDSGSLASAFRSFDFSYFGAKESSRFEYQNLRLVSFKKVDGKWHVTAKFENASGVISPNIIHMVIDDNTGEVSEMSGT